MSALVRVEFREIVVRGIIEEERFLLSVGLPFVPLPGELVNVKGHPYTVRSRSFAVGEEEEITKLFAYLQVVPISRRNLLDVEGEV